MIADGVKLFDGVLKPGKPQQVTASTLARVWLSRGGVVDITVNGHDLGAPGTKQARVRGVVHADRLPGATIAGRVAPLGIGWPNIISALRIVLVPVLVVLILVDTGRAASSRRRRCS